MGLKVFFAVPYYGGSHKYWADNLISNGDFDYHLESMTAKHWKWRMQGSAVHLAEQYQASDQDWDVLLFSTMTDLSLFKAMTNCSKPIAYYMHENQLTYPFSKNDNREKEDFHYGFLNFKSCLAADLILFNSDYHRKEFLKSLKKLLFRLPDFVDADKVVKALFEKSEISWVGLDFKAMNKFRIKSPPSHPNQEPTLLWNHRWDHDKNPELFLDLCSYLEQQSVPYKLILLGENGNAAGIKTKLIERFKDNIEFEGYVLDKQEYYALIQKATLLPVTADQDFYGLSTMEAIYLGVTPLLPTNKVYNEFYLEKLFPELYYDNIDELHQRAEKNCSHINFFNLSSDLLRKHDISLTARQLESYLKKMKHSHAI